MAPCSRGAPAAVSTLLPDAPLTHFTQFPFNPMRPSHTLCTTPSIRCTPHTLYAPPLQSGAPLTHFMDHTFNPMHPSHTLSLSGGWEASGVAPCSRGAFTVVPTLLPDAPLTHSVRPGARPTHRHNITTRIKPTRLIISVAFRPQLLSSM